MKKQYIAAFACILAAACSKAELNEVDPGSSGESMTLTLPQTKVAISGDSYQFELDDEITAIASNGSRATLKPNTASSGATRQQIISQELSTSLLLTEALSVSITMQSQLPTMVQQRLSRMVTLGSFLQATTSQGPKTGRFP